MPRLSGFLLLLILTLANQAVAQNYTPINTPDDQAGFKPYQPNDGSNIDTVNVATGNLVLHIPLLSYPQRGAHKVSFELVYNGTLAQYQQVCDERAGTCNPYTLVWSKINGPHFGPGQYLPPGVSVNEMGRISVATKNITFYWPNTSSYKYSAQLRTLYDAYGSSHILGNIGTQSRPPTGGAITESGPWRTLDGSGWKISPLGLLTVASPDGIVYQGSARTDPNGNVLQYNGAFLVDTMGRSIPYPPSATSQSNTDTSGCTGSLAVTAAVNWTPPSLAGGTTSYKFCYASVPLEPFGYGGTTVTPTTMPQSVVLPNGTSYTFEYEDRNSGDPSTVNYGSLTKITLPTGGTISYSYADGDSLTTSVNGQSSTDTITRQVASRTVTDETGGHTWTYGSTTVTDPDGNQTVHQIAYDYDGSPHETGVLYYQGSSATGKLLKNVQTTFNASTPTNFQGVVDYLPVTQTTTLDNGQVAKETYTYDASFTFLDILNTKGALPASYGKIVTRTAYDYGATTVLKQTTTSYMF